MHSQLPNPLLDIKEAQSVSTFLLELTIIFVNIVYEQDFLELCIFYIFIYYFFVFNFLLRATPILSVDIKQITC